MAKPSFCINIMRTDIYENDIRHRVRAFFSSDKSSCQDRLRKVWFVYWGRSGDGTMVSEYGWSSGNSIEPDSRHIFQCQARRPWMLENFLEPTCPRRNWSWSRGSPGQGWRGMEMGSSGYNGGGSGEIKPHPITDELWYIWTESDGRTNAEGREIRAFEILLFGKHQPWDPHAIKRYCRILFSFRGWRGWWAKTRVY